MDNAGFEYTNKYLNRKAVHIETGGYKIVDVSGILFIGMIVCDIKGTGFGDFSQGAFIWDVSKK